MERLMHFATALQHDVVIEIRPCGAGDGRRSGVGRLEEWMGGAVAQPSQPSPLAGGPGRAFARWAHFRSETDGTRRFSFVGFGAGG